MSAPIVLLPVGAPDPGVIAVVADALVEAFGVAVHPSRHRLDPRSMYDPARDQYSSRLMLGALLERIRAPNRVLGITDVDLFMPILTFVFGEAQLGGRAALISTYRLSPTYYGMPASTALFYERAVKEALHELGHTYGLLHCPDYRCVMTPSRTVEEIDLKEATFCAFCRAKLDGRLASE